MRGIGRFWRVGLCVGALLTAAGAGTGARANELAEVEVTLLDGATEAGALVAFSPNALKLRSPEETRNVPRADIAHIRFFPTTSKPPVDGDGGGGDWVLDLTNTSHFHGTVLDSESDSLRVRTRFAKRYDLVFDRLQTIRRSRESATSSTRKLFESARAKPLPGSDTLITRGAEAKAVRGTLITLGPKRSTFLFNGKRRSLATEKVYGVIMAATSTTPHPPPPARIILENGDSLAGTVETITREELTWRDGEGAAQRVPISSIRMIEFTSRRVVYMSDLAPTSFSSSGVVHANRNFRRDRNVANFPMRLRGRVYDKGLGVRAHSVLVFELSEPFETFVANVGVDDAVGLGGSVVFRVMADGKQVFTSGIVRGGDEVQRARVPLEGVKQLTLIVDFADNADVGDWANWANARLIKPREDAREVY